MTLTKRMVLQEIARLDKYDTETLVLLEELIKCELYVRTSIDWM